MNAPDDQKSGPPEASPIQPLAATIGQLPGEFAIRTYLKDTFLTARDGGRHSINAVTTDATLPGARLFEKFKLTALQPDFTTIQTVFAFFVSALGGGGSTNAAQVLQTERTTVADDALFRFVGPNRNGVYSIGTFNNHFLTALGGGGKTTDAFHTDATSASTWEQFRLIKMWRSGIRLHVCHHSNRREGNKQSFEPVSKCRRRRWTGDPGDDRFRRPRT